jgi:cell division protein FtsB
MAATTARRHAAGTRSRPRTGRAAGRGGVRWDRVARVSLLVVLALIVASYVGPAAGYLEAWRLAKETRAEVTDLRRDNDRLRERARRLASSEAVELEARRAGMGRPGEQIYVIRGLPKER